MTGGVKQALPQVLMPKSGPEGKAARNRAPQADFAEALGIGRSSKKSTEAKADRQGIEAKPLWQRLAAKLDTAASHSREIAAKLEAAASPSETKRQGDDKIDKHHEDGKHQDPAARQAADAVQAQTLPTASTPAPADATGQAEAAARSDPSISREGRSAPADRNVIATDAKAASPEPALKQDSATPIFVPMVRSSEDEPIRFEPAASPATAPTEQSSPNRTQAKDDQREASAESAKTAPRVTILAQQSIPAPVPQTSFALAESIAASDLLEPARNPPALDAIHNSVTHASAQSLKIQLHPAELGMVTATLRFAGEQLSIELQVENHEAYRHLSSDSDTIVNSLRGLGYEVDRVTVLQPQLAKTPSGRSDASASMPSPQGRAPDQFGFGTAGTGGNGGSGGRQPSDGGNAGHGNHRKPTGSREKPGSGLYI